MVSFYNDRRKFCPGCKKHRSLSQYASDEERFCNTCVLRGEDKRPEPKGTAGRIYQPSQKP